MTKSRSRDPCRWLFKWLEILPLQSQYIFSVLLFVVRNKELYTSNQDIHNIYTRSNVNLHPPVCNLTIFQKGVYFFSGMKLFNCLPLKIKSLSSEINLLELAFKKFTYLIFILYPYPVGYVTFYGLTEYEINRNTNTVEEYSEYSYNLELGQRIAILYLQLT
jgi:hypothetical protein